MRLSSQLLYCENDFVVINLFLVEIKASVFQRKSDFLIGGNAAPTVVV